MTCSVLTFCQFCNLFIVKKRHGVLPIFPCATSSKQSQENRLRLWRFGKPGCWQRAKGILT